MCQVGTGCRGKILSTFHVDVTMNLFTTTLLYKADMQEKLRKVALLDVQTEKQLIR